MLGQVPTENVVHPPLSKLNRDHSSMDVLTSIYEWRFMRKSHRQRGSKMPDSGRRWQSAERCYGLSDRIFGVLVAPNVAGGLNLLMLPPAHLSMK